MSDIAREAKMAFRNESISEADQSLIDYQALRDSQGGGPIVDPPKWTVDRERDAFLIRLGGGMNREDYHVPHYFQFSLRNERLRVDAFKERVPSDEPMLANLFWKVVGLHLTEFTSISREEITRTLTEAFIAYGSTGFAENSHINVKVVEVDFSGMREVVS